ncbi:TMEM175 family protein [Mucilaginibacter ginkgonis]|uniref:DUF1211 domain-containing protein n=1 Tax=Mucilaginibacter ginkgonis TaxID=2682091 RepID=A0A7T7F966_9SPHI|nr:TMEM175 family protein [Mucilaginibacter ginkgonis]QQL49057.1 DUF1211 domain-containing protein [Mucilaginibacter ginkgonis]
MEILLLVMEMQQKKPLELERLIFFSDAIVAIAITLLAFNLKLDVPAGKPLTFADLMRPWETYLTFVLSFLNIAGFWQTHHTIFVFIRKIDRKMVVLNLVWLFFIVILPFTTSVIGSHFGSIPAVFLYCSNVFMLSLMQKFIWDYGNDETADKAYQADQKLEHIDTMFTLHLLNGVVAIACSFFYPVTAFILLFFKIPLFVAASFYIAGIRRQQKRAGKVS